MFVLTFLAFLGPNDGKRERTFASTRVVGFTATKNEHHQSSLVEPTISSLPSNHWDCSQSAARRPPWLPTHSSRLRAPTATMAAPSPTCSAAGIPRWRRRIFLERSSSGGRSFLRLSRLRSKLYPGCFGSMAALCPVNRLLLVMQG